MRRVVPPFLVDACLVLLFALIGRASHVEAVTALGVLSTAWPFLAGLVLGWGVARGLWRDWPRQVGQAVPIWLVTVLGGLVLRVLSGGGGAPLSFAVVATVVLGAFIVGWRALTATLLFATDGLRSWSERQAARQNSHR